MVASRCLVSGPGVSQGMGNVGYLEVVGDINLGLVGFL